MDELEQTATLDNGATQNEQVENVEQNESTIQEELLDLDKYDKKFRFDGKELTLEELRNSTLRHSDYTKKTQELAQERKYYDNLAADLSEVKKNPALVAKFKEVYPEKFHGYLSYVSQDKPNSQAVQAAKLDPELQAVIDEARETNSFVKEQRLQAAEQEIGTIFDKLAQKYEMAHEGSVISMAQAYIAQKKQETGKKEYKPSEKEYEQFFKQSHDELTKRADKYYQNKINAQKTANKSADAGAGGGTPGQAPKTPRTIQEARDQMLSELNY